MQIQFRSIKIQNMYENIKFRSIKIQNIDIKVVISNINYGSANKKLQT